MVSQRCSDDTRLLCDLNFYCGYDVQCFYESYWSIFSSQRLLTDTSVLVHLVLTILRCLKEPDV